nr:hypothetical protein [Kocuria sp.]
MDESVGLEVTLEHDPQSHLVGQVEGVVGRRVVAGADRVDVVASHELVLPAGEVGVHRAAPARVELVPVDAAEAHRGAVDLKDAVGGDDDAAESGAVGDELSLGAQGDVVEVRVLGGPGTHDPDGQLHPVGAVHGGG